MKKTLPATLGSSDISTNNTAISPVIGIILLILLTVLLAGITISSVYGKDYSSSLQPAPMAVIEVESVVGGVPYKFQFAENFIVLVHKGGAPLQADSTMIIVNGQGCSPTGVIGQGGSNKFGDILIVYDGLAYHGKNSQYASRNQNISDGVWSPGEIVVLNGKDSPIGNAFSSVHVTIKGMDNTSDNYGLKENSVITIKVFDRDSNKIIAEAKHKVTPVK
jgi:FlaG/FlaF family flagellin (archaellin)